MTEVTITGLTRNAGAKPNRGGNTILAYFDCEARGFALYGCAFFRTERGGLNVTGPRLDASSTDRRRVVIEDGALKADMIRQVQEAYRLMGGTDGEWTPRASEGEDRVTGQRSKD